MGYPTFANFDYIPWFDAYRLVIYAFPVGALAVYSLLAWRSLAAAAVSRSPTARHRTDAGSSAGLNRPTRRWLDRRGRSRRRFCCRPLVVVVAASARSNGHHHGITVRGLLCGLAYLVGVTLLSAAISGLRMRPNQLWWVQVRSAIPAINGIAGAMAAIFGLWYVSRHSVVVVLRDNSVHPWPWLPGWLAALGMLAAAAWGVMRLRHGPTPVAVEKRLLAVVVGAVAVFLITSRMPGQLGRFQGFDDAQNLVGANLLGKGYFPWRDLLFIHGLWMDALQSTLGFSVFGDTRWGSNAGSMVLLTPVCWVIIYSFAVWFSRSDRWFLIWA